MSDNIIPVKVARSAEADGPARVDSFQVPWTAAMTVQTMLRYIFENLDPTLAFRDFRCGRGVCNTCRVKVNGAVKRSCETPVNPGVEILVEPASSRVIKDLVVAFD
ncbi:MAG: 2Fe-2S iron-sulfur cluster-binding protein [Thermodesulfobacteriota bacterium]